MEKVLVDEVAFAPAGADAAGLSPRVEEALGELAGAAKEGLLMIDGSELKGRTNVVALGSTTDG